MRIAGDNRDNNLRRGSVARLAAIVTVIASTFLCERVADASETRAIRQLGIASWYGEQHRGRLMSNGQPFDPAKLTAASWFHPLGTRLRVTLWNGTERQSVTVTVTDRGPAKRLVNQGRIIDLSHEAFKNLADPNLGLVRVTVERAS